MIRVAVIGAKGKMGQLAVKHLPAERFAIVAELGREDDLSQALPACAADVALELTSADSVFVNVQAIIAAGVRPVIGSSGLLPEQIEFLQQQCTEKSLAALLVPNFSVGAVLMMRFAEQAARFFPQVQIVESHHLEKKDAPSGTALSTARRLQAEFADEIDIVSHRLPNVVAEQQVIFSSAHESLLLEHKSLSRESFVQGMQLACEQVMQLQGFHCGLDSFLFKE